MDNIYKWWLAACVYHEARGECFEGQVAVAQVIFNRAAKRRRSVLEVIRADKQFSRYNGNKKPPIDDYEAFIICMDAVDSARNKRLEGDTFRGADHYHGDYMSRFPVWSDGMKVVARIGKHIFYRS